MRKLILLVFAVALSLKCTSQNVYLDSTSTWKEIGQYCDFVNQHYETYCYKIIGDTIINSNVYYKLYKIGFDSVVPPNAPSHINIINQYVGAITEDSLKFIFIRRYQSVERILYNFDFLIGDTIPYENYNSSACYPSIISDIDTIYFGNIPRKKFLMANVNNAYYYIEGVGSNTGLLGYLCITLNESASRLICYSQANIDLQISPTVNCDIFNEIDIYKTSLNNELIITPNPFSTNTRLQFENSHHAEFIIEIFNIYGLVVVR